MNNIKQERKTNIIVIIIYIILMFIIGIIQLINWYLCFDDPLGNILFYIFIIPSISFVLGVLEGNIKRYYLIPLIPLALTFFMYVFMANGRFIIDVGAIIFSFISFIVTWFGIGIYKVIVILGNELKI